VDASPYLMPLLDSLAQPDTGPHTCQRPRPSSRALWYLELAKLHVALAQVAATALNSDGQAMAGSRWP
jgi:hypothetical protein